MNNVDFVKKLEELLNYDTLYVTGGIGQPLTYSTKEFFIKTYKDNIKRTETIRRSSEKTFAFDCSGMIKAIIWGWCGNKNNYLGGAEYETNGLPDISTEDMLNNFCTDVSTDFNNIVPGELVWIPGHVGITINKNEVIECTPSWKNKVQITNFASLKSSPIRKWQKHGRLKMINYIEVITSEYKVSNTSIRRGVKGKECKLCQLLLQLNGYYKNGELDGSCGFGTESAIKEFQESHKLEVDGSCGKKTWAALKEII